MQSAAIPPSPTRQTTPNPAWEGCKPVIIAVIPEPSSPKNGRPRSAPQVRTDSLQNRTQPAGRSATSPNAHKLADVWGPGSCYCTTQLAPSSQEGMDGWLLPIPSAQASRDRQRGGATIPPFRRSECSARYPPTGCRRGYMGKWAGEKHGLRDWGRVKLARRRGRSGRCLCRQVGCVLAGGWLGTRSIHYCCTE